MTITEFLMARIAEDEEAPSMWVGEFPSDCDECKRIARDTLRQDT